MHQCCYSPVFFFFFIVESWLAMEMIGQQVFVTKCWRLISAWIAVTARLQHSQQGGNTGRKHGNQDDVDSSRYNQARFLFAFAFKWFHVCYAKCYAEGTRVKSNRCTTQTCIFIQHNGCFVSRIFLSFLLSFSSIFFYLSFFFSFPVFLATSSRASRARRFIWKFTIVKNRRRRRRLREQRGIN